MAAIDGSPHADRAIDHAADLAIHQTGEGPKHFEAGLRRGDQCDRDYCLKLGVRGS